MFKIGDRVRYIWNTNTGIRTGEVGTVIKIWSDNVTLGVDWDEYNRGRHNCDGLCESGHGWHVGIGAVEPVYDIDYGEFQVSDLSIIL